MSPPPRPSRRRASTPSSPRRSTTPRAPSWRARPTMRVVTAEFGAAAGTEDVDLRSILGGMLAQERDQVTEGRVAWGPRVAAGGVPRGDEAPADHRRMAGAALRVARLRAREVEHRHLHRRAPDAGRRRRADEPGGCRERGCHESARIRSIAVRSVAASDAFFPFRDGLDAVAAAGATAVVQPGGSVKDAEVIAAADEHGLAMVFTGFRHFRH